MFFEPYVFRGYLFMNDELSEGGDLTNDRPRVPTEILPNKQGVPLKKLCVWPGMNG